MLKKRLIPILLLQNESLVKTKQFKNYIYVGDPCNTVRIFNELEVDELIFLDIGASINNKNPNLKILEEISNECFMPLTYGGGIKTLDQAKAIFDIGYEKIAINTSAVINPILISDISKIYGSQAVVVSVDVKKNLFNNYNVMIKSGKINSKLNLINWVKYVENLGAGEILFTSIDREGTWTGLDLEIIKQVTDALSIPVIANGGVGSLNDIKNIFNNTNISAVGVGSMVIYQKKGMGVLVNYPEKNIIDEILK